MTDHGSGYPKGSHGDRGDSSQGREGPGRRDRNFSNGHSEGRRDHRGGGPRNDRRRKDSYPGSSRRRGRHEDGDRRYSNDRDDRGRRHDHRDGDRDRGGHRRKQGGGYQKNRGTGGRGPRKQHSQRGGEGRSHTRYAPQRSGFREERLNKRINEPEIPADIDFKDLDPMILQDLKVLSKHNAEKVAAHLAAAAVLMEESPVRALEHARAAKDRAGRVAITRETNGIAAYHAGEWREALAELRAARRMSDGPGLMAVMADCERALGRPDRALEMYRSPEAEKLDEASKIELAIVAAGARRELGQADAALTTLEAAGVSETASGEPAARLSYAYADQLLESGRREDALHWFTAAAAQDEFETTDAAQRIAELSGDAVE